MRKYTKNVKINLYLSADDAWLVDCLSMRESFAKNPGDKENLTPGGFITKQLRTGIKNYCYLDHRGLDEKTLLEIWGRENELALKKKYNTLKKQGKKQAIETLVKELGIPEKRLVLWLGGK
jgi:hypothetical protein